MTHPTDTAKSEELKACSLCGAECRVEHFPGTKIRETPCDLWMCSNSRVFMGTCDAQAAFDADAWNKLNRRSSPPQNDAGVEGLREAVERFIADYDDGDRADAGTNPLMEAHIADLRAAISAPASVAGEADPLEVGFWKEKAEHAERERDVWKERAMDLRLSKPTPVEAGLREALDAPLGEKVCMDCHGHNPVWFAPNEVWNFVIGGLEAKGDPGGFYCPNCFIVRAEKAGVIPSAWKLEMETIIE